jgi:hypothetical protein
MKMRDEDVLYVFDADPRLGESTAQRLFGLGGVETSIDEAPTMRSFDQIGVDDRKTTDRERDGDAPDAGRNEIAQRAMGPREVTLGTMERLRPVRLAAQDTALSRQRPPVRIRYGLHVRDRALIGLFTIALIAGLACTPETARATPTPTVAPTTAAPTTAAPTPTRTTTPAPTTAPPSPTVVPTASASPIGTAPTTCPALTGGSAIAGPQVAALRAAHNGGFDRLVIEFTGAVVPQYEVKIASTFVAPSGQAIRVDGNAFVSVRVGGQAHTDAGQRSYPQSDPYRPGLPLIREVKLVTDFEGVVIFGVGLERLACPTLLVLAAPPRIALDFPTPP